MKHYCSSKSRTSMTSIAEAVILSARTHFSPATLESKSSTYVYGGISAGCD
jgi:hypothetical protein